MTRSGPAVLALLILLSLPPAAASAAAPTLAAALRADGPLIVADCGADRPHQPLADKVADDLRPLRGGVRPERVACSDLDRLRWDDANVVVLASEPDDPVLLAVAPGIELRERGRGLDVAGMRLKGSEVAVALSLPHPSNPRRWVMVLYGITPAALRSLDRHIRNDIAASALVVDGQGERLASLVEGEDGWRVYEGHPYEAAEVRGRFEAWREESGAKVVGWGMQVEVVGEGLEVGGEVEVEGGSGRGRGEVWLQLTARAEIVSCSDACVPYDARDGRILVRLAAADAGRVSLAYRAPFEGILHAWHVGEATGYVMPEANWFPRIRGEVDEPYLARGPWSVELDAGGAGLVHVDPEGTPVLVWGEHERVDLPGGFEAYLPPGAVEEVAEHASELAGAVARRARDRDVTVVAVDRPVAWYGGGWLLAPPDLLQPGPVDELEAWHLDRALGEASARLPDPGGRVRIYRGQVASLHPEVTVRLWRLRGSWWQLLDEGAVDAGGTFELKGRGHGRLLITASAPSRAPGVLEVRGPRQGAGLQVEPGHTIDEVALVCLRCGPDLSEQRFSMALVGPDRYQVTLQLGDLFREYGSFPYGFELNPGGDAAVLVPDPRRPVTQFPSFLSPEEFHADTVTFELDTTHLRFWIETPGAMIAPQGWLVRGDRVRAAAGP